MNGINLYIQYPNDVLRSVSTPQACVRLETDELTTKFLQMRQYLDSLKHQLNNEKDMLQREKQELYNRRILQQQTPLWGLRADPLLTTSRQHLKDIEQKCDLELLRLDKFVDSIKGVREYWKVMKQFDFDGFEQLQPSRRLRNKRSIRGRRMHHKVPSTEWLSKNRTFI